MIDIETINRTVSTNDQEIDDLMAEYGFEWVEENLEYVKAGQTVSGDFASHMAKRIKFISQNYERDIKNLKEKTS
jgi:hypothetical protein